MSEFKEKVKYSMTGIQLTSEQARFLIQKDGKITMAGIKELLKLPKDVKEIKIQKPNKNLSEIKFLLREAGIDFVEEYKFTSDRKLRFDLAILPHKIYIEYEGLIAKKSRHTTISGYSKDCEKYNLAASEGWTGLRYTALNFTNVVSDVNKVINKII